MRISATLGAALAVAFGAMIVTPAGSAQAQTKDELVRSLQAPATPPPTRGLSRGVSPSTGNAASARTRSLVNSLKGKATRQITVEERTEIAEVVKENNLPSVDLEIYFDYDSAEITPVAMPKLITLGQALSNAKFKGSTFMVAGHTDARGSNGYNQALSERRAESIKGFLVHAFHLDPQSLIAVGYGEEQLKHPDAPGADDNRRVQVVNLAVN